MGSLGVGRQLQAWKANHVAAYSFYLSCDFRGTNTDVKATRASRRWRLWPHGLPGSRTLPRGPGDGVRSPSWARRGPQLAETPVRAPLHSHIPARRQRLGAGPGTQCFVLRHQPQRPGSRNPPAGVVSRNHTLSTTERPRTQAAGQNSLTLTPNVPSWLQPTAASGLEASLTTRRCCALSYTPSS